MFNPRNGPPYSPEFVEAYRAAQVARQPEILHWALQQLNERPDWPDGLADMPFVVYGTNADPRFLDGRLEPSERVLGVAVGHPGRSELPPCRPGPVHDDALLAQPMVARPQQRQCAPMDA